MPMPQDPLMMLFQQASQNILAMNSQIAKATNELISTANMFAPHNVMANMAVGQGYYSAKLPTTWLNERNIYG